jgi:TolA-binding protein
LPYLPDNRQFKRRRKRVHVEAPAIHLSGHGGHMLMWIGIALLLTAGMVYLGRMVYLLDQDNVDGDQEQVESVVDELHLKITQLESQRDTLSQSVATLERAAQVDKVAQRVVQEELISLQEQSRGLEQELAILKRVAGKTKSPVSAKGSKKSTAKKRKSKKKTSRKTKKINKSLPTTSKKAGGF